MNIDNNLLSSASHVKATLSATASNFARAKDKDDPYTWGDYAKELANGTMAANSLIGGATLIASAVISAPALTTVGRITGAAGATQFALQRFKKFRERS